MCGRLFSSRDAQNRPAARPQKTQQPLAPRQTPFAPALRGPLWPSHRDNRNTARGPATAGRRLRGGPEQGDEKRTMPPPKGAT